MQEKNAGNAKVSLAIKGIVSRVIDTEGLEHAPETVAEMDGQGNKGQNIEERVKEVAQQCFDGLRNEDTLRREGEAEDMDKKKCQNEKSGVGHGFRGE